jgi:predicted 3-demethylubiquinone-9 3-methyltransferase (glyoxalase superfamily)
VPDPLTAEDHRYGLCWQIVPAAMLDMLGAPDQQKVAGVMRAMMTMTKFDIAEIEKAYAGA